MHRQIHQPSKFNLVGNGWNSPTEQLVSESLVWSPRRIIWQLINAFMVVFFLMAAIVQINDPDPYLWIPVYAIPALLCGAVVCKPAISENFVWRMICLAHLTACICGATYLLVLVVEMMAVHWKNPLILEEGRELSGLVIIACWLAVVICTGYLSSSKNTNLRGRWPVSVFLVISCIFGVTPLFVWSLCFVDSMNALTHCIAMETVGNGSVLDSSAT